MQKFLFMIQRIQSLYLLLAALLTGSLFFINLVNIYGIAGDFALLFYGIVNVGATQTETIVFLFPLALLMVATFFSIFISIFLYRKRVLQIRLCGINMGLLTGLVVMIIYLGVSAAKKWEMDYSFSFAIVFPIIAIVLIYLSLRAIGKDEALVRSIDRIR